MTDPRRRGLIAALSTACTSRVVQPFGPACRLLAGVRPDGPTSGMAGALALGTQTVAQAVEPGAALPPEVAGSVPEPRLQGRARMRYFGFQLYEALLWSGARAVGSDWAGVPFALELVYARAFTGRQIAERSLLEMKRQTAIAAADAARWMAWLQQSVPDVHPGERVTGVNLPGTGARFFVNGRPSGDAPDPVFARLFFGIWLAPQTSEPDLRLALLGRGPT